MAAAAWLHGSTNMRLTEGLVSVLKEDRPEYLPALLANYREHGGVSAQNSAAVGGLIGLSNGRIGSSKTRFEGLCLLAVLVRDSSSDLFQQHCLSWLRSLQQVIQSQAPLPTVQLAVTILQDLLQYSSQLPELAREVGLNSVLGILTSLLGLKFECHLVAMEGMKACMIYYPRACGSLRDKLGAYFLSKMDSDDPKAQEVACECYGRLPCLGGVLERGGGARRAESWVNQLHCLLATAHSLLAQLYQGAESEGAVRYEGPGVELPFPPLDEADPLLQLQLRLRYRAVCLGLTRTLSTDPLSPVCLPVHSLLNLVCRGLAVSCKSVNVSGDGALRLLVLPSVHADTLDVLRAFITAAGSRLVQFCNIVTRLLSQTLSAWSPQPETSPGQQRAYSAVRVSVYRTLELWVQVAGPSAGVLQGSPTHTELLLVHLLTDITPGVESVKLRAGPSAASEHAGKTPSRRAKGVGDGGGVSLQKKGDALANQDTCVSALKALRQIILTSGTLLKEDVHKRLQDLVVPLCVRLQQQQCGNDVAGASGQYGSASPRRELHRVLLALVLAPPPRCPPPLPCAVSIFSHGRRDHSLKVSCFCTEALAICNALLHPRVPSIALPLPPLAVKSTPAAPTLAPSQNPSLSLPTLLGGPTAAPPFPARHPIGLGPTALMAPLENHLPLVPPVLPAATGPTASDLLLSPHQPGELPPLGTAEGRRPVFVRYDKEEADDVEISLESDSDDSVVIVPPGMLILEAHDSAGPQPVPPPPGGATPGLAVSAGSDSGAVNSPLPNDLPSTVALSSNSNVVTTFPSQSQTQLVSLVPPINSSVAQLGTPSIGLGDSLPGTQLQQMLLQSPAAQPSQMGLPIQIQLQTQLAQSSRQLQQAQQQPMASEEDLTVININSSDEDEDEEEEMDEDDIGEEEDEEEEEPLDDEEEEEEVSDFPEDYYDGEEFADYEEEEEELIEGEEEESIVEGDEEDGDEVPPLEGESERAFVEREEGEALLGPVVEGVVGAFCTEEGEVQEGLSRGGQVAAYRQDGIQEEVKHTEVEELEAIEPGVDESKRAEVEKSSVVCQDVHSDSQHHSSTEEASQEDELTEEAGADGGQEVTTHEQEVAPKGDLATLGEAAVTLQERIPESSQEAREPDERAGATGTREPPDAERREEAKEAAAAGGPGERATSPVQDERPEREEDEENGDDVKGRKRKREEGAVGEVEQSTEKKKVNEDSMASMLADFVECPPDEEENTRPATQC